MNKTNLIKNNDFLFVAPKARTYIKINKISFSLNLNTHEYIYIDCNYFENKDRIKIQQSLTTKEKHAFISISINLLENELESLELKEAIKLFCLKNKKFELNLNFSNGCGYVEHILKAFFGQYEMYIIEEKMFILNIKIPYKPISNISI